MIKKVSPEVWREDLAEFREKTDEFYEGKLDKNAYKGFSGGFGSYAQRGGHASMVRLRMAGGRMTKDKLKFVADCIEKHQIGRVHLTTCQTVQLHDLHPAAIYDVVDHALDHGIVTRGGGGDFPRNVMVSPLSGVEQGEYFDVLPYAEAAGEYLMTFIKVEKMPRKLKVGFSNCPENVTHATFRDLGFVARPDGNFDVYSAGGLGNNPRMGLPVAQDVSPSKILYYICAMRDTFLAYGNYEKRNKARTRYMQETLGEEGYVRAYQEKLEAVFAAHSDLDLDITPAPIAKQGDGSAAQGPRVIPQKQNGLYTVQYHPLGGCPAPAKFGELYGVIRDMEDVEIRLSPDETMYIVNLTGSEAETALAATEDGAHSRLETSVACIGASICQVGLRDSQEMLREIVEATRAANLPDGVLPQVHISGCPSSCGTHQIGEIGFHGGIKVINREAKPAFTLHLNGCDTQGREQFGEQAGMMLQEQIPAFLVELGKTVEAAGQTYEEWRRDNGAQLEAIAAKHVIK